MIKKKISYSSETKCKMLGPPQPHCDLTLLVGLRGKREGDGMGKRHLVSRGISLEVITEKFYFSSFVISITEIFFLFWPYPLRMEFPKPRVQLEL